MVRIRAHMVSKAYLRAWADHRNRVDVLDYEVGRGYPSGIGNATVVSEAYESNILSPDLEKIYAEIESRGIGVISKLIERQPITPSEQDDMIGFLDMHLNRGRYANRSGERVPAKLLTIGGHAQDGELSLGDILLLSKYVAGVVRLKELGIDAWPWQVQEAKHLATGDGAVLLWKASQEDQVSTVSFPLSPTKLLVIGRDLPLDAPLNPRLAMNSRRWVVGEIGSLDYSQAAVTAAVRAAERAGKAAESGADGLSGQ